LSNGIIAMTIDPNPYALRSVTWNFGLVASICAAYMRAPLRRMPRFSDARPGITPGLSARNTSGRWKESATLMKCAALSAPSTSTEPAITFGWFAITATGWPPRYASTQSTVFPNFGWISKHESRSKTTSTTSRMS
jgi:hypothetical protein